MYEDDLLPITEYEILKEVSKELDIPMKDVEKTFSIWMSYLKMISKETDQSMVDFTELGKMYYSKGRAKNITAKIEKEERAKKFKHIDEFFEGIEFKNNHDDIPIVLRWGLNRPNHRLYEKANFTTEYLVERQNKKFYEGTNKFIK